MYSRSEVDKLTFSGRYGDFKPKTIEELTVKNHEEGESFILFLGCSTNPQYKQRSYIPVIWLFLLE